MSKEVKAKTTMMMIAALAASAAFAETAYAAVSVGRVSVPARVSAPAPVRSTPAPAPARQQAAPAQRQQATTAPVTPATNPALFMGAGRKSDCDPAKDKDCRK